MKRLSLLTFYALLATPAFAGGGGLYLGGHVGFSWIESSNTKLNNQLLNANQVPLSQLNMGFNKARDRAFAGGISAGYDFSQTFSIPLRVELDYTLRDSAKTERQEAIATINDLSINYTEKLDAQTLMTNVWFDIPTGSAMTPYIGGGLGTAFVKYANATNYLDDVSGKSTGRNSHTSHNANLAWQLGTGINYAVTSNLAIDIGYRYLDMGKAKSDNTIGVSSNNTLSFKTETKIASSEIIFGTRYLF